MFAISGGTLQHSVLGFNLGREIGNRLKDGCTVAGFDTRVHVEASRLYTLEEYILVSPCDYSIDQFLRNESGIWTFQGVRGEDSILEIASVRVTVLLKPIYKGVDFTLANEE